MLPRQRSLEVLVPAHSSSNRAGAKMDAVTMDIDLLLRFLRGGSWYWGLSPKHKGGDLGGGEKKHGYPSSPHLYQ